MKRNELIKLQQLNAEKTNEIINKQGLKLHHVASRRGYACAESLNRCEEYAGKFGKGIVVNIGKYRNSNNFTAIAYYLK